MRKDIELILEEVKKVIVGKNDVIEKIMIAILADGHILLDDVPGVGKTSMAIAISKALGLNYKRIQFTPDVMPSDIVGFTIYNKSTGKFEFKPGIVQEANILLGDEINRTSSKTQSALLETMEERQVTVDGNTHKLKTPFMVIATQNNVNSIGTQLLPYAQLDRFLIKISVGYPDAKSQITIMKDRQTENPIDSVKQVASVDDIISMQKSVSEVTVVDEVLEYIVALTEATRNSEFTELGVSPRGTLSLCNMAKAKAFVNGKDYVVPEDVIAVFEDVCAHRIILNSKGRAANETSSSIISSIIKTVKIPDGLKA